MNLTEDWRGPAIYTNNQVSDELVQSVKDALEDQLYIYVSFDVIGRTRHVCLSHELMERLGDDYKADIDYDMYGCKVSRVSPVRRVSVDKW